jgi:hypothetical protein
MNAVNKFFFVAIAMICTTHVRAQHAYWVTESNRAVKDNTLVKIYDHHDSLIAQHELKRHVSIQRSKDVRLLNRLVRSAVRDQQVRLRYKQKVEWAGGRLPRA